ncbi:hypothetical protein, partial [Yersinia pestis]|uniref:hypothetical protein n=3 Tax=Yersinia pestis TaxID=632 RepID=UPI001ED989CA
GYAGGYLFKFILYHSNIPPSSVSHKEIYSQSAVLQPNSKRIHSQCMHPSVIWGRDSDSHCGNQSEGVNPQLKSDIVSV